MNSDNFIALATNDREVLAPAPSACDSAPSACNSAPSARGSALSTCDNGNEIMSSKAMISDESIVLETNNREVLAAAPSACNSAPSVCVSLPSEKKKKKPGYTKFPYRIINFRNL